MYRCIAFQCRKPLPRRNKYYCDETCRVEFERNVKTCHDGFTVAEMAEETADNMDRDDRDQLNALVLKLHQIKGELESVTSELREF